MLDFHASRPSFWRMIRLILPQCALAQCKLFQRNNRMREQSAVSASARRSSADSPRNDVVNIQYVVDKSLLS